MTMEAKTLPKEYTIELSAYMGDGNDEAPYRVGVSLKKTSDYGGLPYTAEYRVIAIDGFNREQMERLVNQKIDDLMASHGIMPEQVETLAQFESFVKEFNALYPSLEESDEPVKKKWWQR